MLKRIAIIIMALGCLGLTACGSGSSQSSSENTQTHMFGDFNLNCGSESCM